MSEEYSVYPQSMKFEVVRGKFSIEIKTTKDPNGLTWVQAYERLKEMQKAA